MKRFYSFLDFLDGNLIANDRILFLSKKQLSKKPDFISLSAKSQVHRTVPEHGKNSSHVFKNRHGRDRNRCARCKKKNG